MKTILIVEDNSSIQLLLNQYFRNYNVISTTNVKDAILKVQTVKVDLIILDIILEGRETGYAFISYLEHILELKTPIIIFSAYPRECDIHTPFIQKGNWNGFKLEANKILLHEV